MHVRSSMLFVLVALAAAAVPQGTLAQTTSSRSVSNAKELPRDDPRAQRASSTVKLLVKGDDAAAVKYLKTHAVPKSSLSLQPQSKVDEMRTLLAADMVVDRIIEGPDDDVVVMLSSSSGARGGRMSLMFQIERKAPHRLIELGAIQGAIRRSGGN